MCHLSLVTWPSCNARPAVGSVSVWLFHAPDQKERSWREGGPQNQQWGHSGKNGRKDSLGRGGCVCVFRTR